MSAFQHSRSFGARSRPWDQMAAGQAHFPPLRRDGLYGPGLLVLVNLSPSAFSAHPVQGSFAAGDLVALDLPGLHGLHARLTLCEPGRVEGRFLPPAPLRLRFLNGVTGGTEGHPIQAHWCGAIAA